MTDRLTPTAPCSTCAAPIHWGITASGKRIPIDPIPRPNGNLVAEDGRFVIVEPLMHGDRPRYVAHFVTCPQAGQHRRKP